MAPPEACLENFEGDVVENVVFTCHHRWYTLRCVDNIVLTFQFISCSFYISAAANMSKNGYVLKIVFYVLIDLVVCLWQPSPLLRYVK
jgi:hypothetical protein